MGGETRRADLFDAGALATAAEGCDVISRASPVWSLIHTDDAANAFVTAAEAPKTGVWHVVDDRPVPLSAFLGELAIRLGARPPRRMPRWLARMFLGRYGTRILSSSFSTSNARLRRA